MTYYVDVSGGNDNNPGTATDNAWKTINKVNTFSFSPGDRILFKRGGIWREKLVIPSSGSSNNPIMFGDYGSGDLPRLHGGTIISESPVGPDANGVYKFSFSVIYFVIEDNIPVPRASNSDCYDGNWFFDGINTLYYKPTSGVPGDHKIERVTRTEIVNINEKNHITMKNFDLYGSINCVYGRATSSELTNISVDNNTIQYCAAGIKFTAKNGNDLNAIIIRNNRIINSAESLYLGSENNGIESIKASYITNNTIINTGYYYGLIKWNHFFPSDQEAIGIQNPTGLVISGNTIYGGVSGITIWGNANTRSMDEIISYNYIHDMERYGLVVGGEDVGANTAEIFYNVIANCGSGEDGGIRLNRPQKTKSEVFNNTLVGNDVNLYLNAATDNFSIINNISMGPINYHVRRNGGIGKNILDYNNYYSDTVIKFKLDTLDENFLSWKSKTSQDAHSLNLDPLFINAGGKNYHLRANSPVINAGARIPITQDFDGKNVPNGSAPDLGAYEY